MYMYNSKWIRNQEGDNPIDCASGAILDLLGGEAAKATSAKAARKAKKKLHAMEDELAAARRHGRDGTTEYHQKSCKMLYLI